MADFKIPDAFDKRATLLQKLREERAQAEEGLRELNKNIALLERALAKDLGLNGAAGSTGGGKRGRRRSSSSVQAELAHVKDEIVEILKKNKEWLNTMALSKELKSSSNADLIGRAKKDLVHAGTIKTKGQKRGAEYHIA